MSVTLLVLTAAATAVNAQRQTSGQQIMGRRVSKTLKMLSPLQSLTIFPKEKQSESDSGSDSDSAPCTQRDNFLPKFQAGLTAETKTRELLARRRELDPNYDDDGVPLPGLDEDWERKLMEKERLREEKEDGIVDRAWDRATAPFEKKENNDKSSSSSSSSSSLSKYQFVGVVQPPNNGSDKKVKWYARKRPSGSKWNVRMIHVNRDAIIRDMFTSGKVDIMGKYVNTGVDKSIEVKEGEQPSLKPLIKGEYSVKPRSLL